MPRSPDRVSVSFKATLQPEQYHSITVEVGLETDLKARESHGKAYSRVSEFLAQKLPEAVNTAFEELGYAPFIEEE